MKKKHHSGRLLMALGLICILCAALLAWHNLMTEQASDQAAQDVLTQLNQQIPHTTPAATEEALQLVVTDQGGLQVEWPMAINNAPLPWPVDGAGNPVPSVTDAHGQTFVWEYDMNRPYRSAAQQDPSSAGNTSAPTDTASPAPQTADVSTATPTATPAPQTADVSTAAPTATPAPQTADASTTAPTASPTATVSAPSAPWTQDSNGNLLPYVSDSQGKILPWMTDRSGEAMAMDLLARMWQGLLDQLTANWLDLLSKPAFVRNPKMAMPVTVLNGHEYIGILDVPSQNISLPIMSEWSYAKLKIAPCRFRGSVYSGDIIIAGHNSNGHFSPIKKLTIGDEVRFTDVDGNVFIYSVIAIEVIGANDLPTMLAGSDVWDLSMFTCSHNSRKRTTVRCKLETYIVAETE